MTTLDFQRKKTAGEKITMVTCYDYWSAQIIDRTDIDCILVGDSLAMVMHGHSSTLPATVDIMKLHVEAVSRGAPQKFIIGDMPFLSFRKGLKPAMDAVEKIMTSGAHAVKLEGVWGHEQIIEHIVQSGVPVMGHVGLTPQSVHQLGGYKVQGRTTSAVEDLLAQAQKLEQLGCFSVVVECVPHTVGKYLAERIKIPVIGIGSGAAVDGQVLVLHDMLGFNLNKTPKFVRRYVDGANIISTALQSFCRDVKNVDFPSHLEVYHDSNV